MTQFIGEIFRAIYGFLGDGGLLLCAFGILFLALILEIFLIRFIENRRKLQRLWVVLLSAALALILHALISFSGGDSAFTIIFCALSLLVCIPLFLLDNKPFKCTEEQRRLVRFIDSQISNQKASDMPITKISAQEEPRVSTAQTVVKEADEEKRYGLDFSHVKNVLKRLDYFGLNPTDKRQVRELELSLVEAEKGQYTEEVKCKINDGLGALLKIMSKYGV